MTIKNFSIEYDANNSHNTFTNGDTITGRIIVEVSSETKIQSLIFIAKGEARVRWSEHHGQHHHHHHHHRRHQVYWQTEKYYNVQQHILSEARQGTDTIGKGRHVFPFTFSIPDRNLPSTFKSSIGKIVHKVKAELKQSMKLTKKAKAHFTFVSKADMSIPGLMEPQYGTKDKSVKVFGSGIVGMDVHIKRMGYKQGDPLEVRLEISNQSSRPVTPKYILYEKKSYFAQGRRKLETKDLFKEKTEEIASGTNKTVTKVIKIPKELPSSILNCPIIKLEYRLKVELDIKCATDPQVKLPIVILPALDTTTNKPPPASATFGFEAFGAPNQTPWPLAYPQQAAPHPLHPPPAYGAQSVYPPYYNTNDTGKFDGKM